jgi:hypothetical protein
MTIWTKPGVRATADEARDITAKRKKAFNQAKAARARWDAELEDGWRRGKVRPYLITRALDLANLHGPDVDAMVGAEEPDVDNWEAGTLYPSLQQLRLLSEVSGFPPSFLVAETPELMSPAMFLCDRSKRGHDPFVPAAPLVAAFTPDSIRARGLSYPERKEIR